jgi:hypothetical protein
LIDVGWREKKKLKLDIRRERREGEATHFDLNVEVLEVERVFPDDDADDGREVEKRALARHRRKLEVLRRRVQALGRRRQHITTKDGKRTRTRQPQPETWMPAVVALNYSLSFLMLPKSASIALLSGPSTPPFPQTARGSSRRASGRCGLQIAIRHYYRSEMTMKTSEEGRRNLR